MIIYLFSILIIVNQFNQFSAHFISNRENINESDKIESLENQSLIEGDILPNSKEENQTEINDQQNLYHAFSLKKSKWKNGIINFKLDKNFYDDEVDKIINAMYKIEKVSCIRFRPKPAKAIDYVKLIKGLGCYSSAGRQGGMQVLSLGKGCINTGTILHELLHSVGFYHTHQRSDRDKYLNIHFNNMKKEYRPQFFKLPKSNVKLLTPFDYQSIMIYGSRAFSKNNQPTMTPKFKFTKSKKPIHLTYPFKKSKLTKYDVLSINRLYKCTKNAKKRSSLLFYSNSDNDEDDDDDDDDEVEFPKVDEIKVDEAKDEEEDDDDGEKLLKEKLNKEKQEKERLAKEKKEKEGLAKEKKLQEKQNKERLAKEKQDKERLAKEKKEKEGLAKEKKLQEKQDKERLAKEKQDKERLAKEKKLKEKLAKDKKSKEKESKEKELKEKEKKRKINLDKQLKEKSNRINLKDKSKDKLLKNNEQKMNKLNKKSDHKSSTNLNKKKNDLTNNANKNDLINDANQNDKNNDEYIKNDENTENNQDDEIDEKILKEKIDEKNSKLNEEVQAPVDLIIE